MSNHVTLKKRGRSAMEGTLEDPVPAGTQLRFQNLSRQVGDKPIWSAATKTVTEDGEHFSLKMRRVAGGEILGVQLKKPGQRRWKTMDNARVPGRDWRVPKVDTSLMDFELTGLDDESRSEVGTLQIRPSRDARRKLVAEPGARLRFTNGDLFVETDVDAKGHFSAVELEAAPGDVVRVAAHDGVTNPRFSRKVSKVVISYPGPLPPPPDEPPSPPTSPERIRNLDDPSPTREHRRGDGSSSLRLKRLTNPLFKSRSNTNLWKVPLQGRIPDCFLVCFATLLGRFRPEALRNQIREIGRQGDLRIFEVTFRNRYGRETRIRVDNEFYIKNGRPVYMRSSNGALWPLVLEKAWAVLRARGDGVTYAGT
jgi:hypothetical protein